MREDSNFFFRLRENPNFLIIQKSTSIGKTAMSEQKRSIFTPEEYYKLRKHVAVGGTKEWKLIANHMGTKTGKQCKDRFREYLSPSITNEAWT
jgi:hypothetical protein